MAKKDTLKMEAACAADEVAGCRRGPTVGEHAEGGVTLVDHDLVQDEIGATVDAPTDASCEIVQGDVWVRKDLELDTAAARSAELCVCADILRQGEAGPELLVTFNGEPVRYEYVPNLPRPISGVAGKREFKKGDRHYELNGQPFRQYWEGDWHRVPIRPPLLRKGTNRVELHAPPGARYQFLIEPGYRPGRSAVSRDGGQTWDSEHLSQAGDLRGEYIVRLALDRHPATGWIESAPIDLWPRVDGTPIARPARIARVRLRAEADRPKGTSVRLQARLGSTPAYDPATWTAWAPGSELAKGEANGRPLRDGKHRFLQWRAELRASEDRADAPRLMGVSAAATVEPKRTARINAGACRIEQPAIVRPSHPFVHARNTARLRLLREHCELDEIVAGKPRGMAQLAALNAWVDSLKLRNKDGVLHMHTPWDGLLFWHNARTELTHRMCTNRAAFFVQCATALGYAARVCIWSHCITEAWAEDVGKWVAFDQSGGHTFTVDGVPASVLDLASAWDGRDRGKIRQTVRQVYTDGREKPLTTPGDFPETDVRYVAWFTRFFVPLRSNWLETPEPHEHGHGHYAFKYDGHLRWLHPERERLPWFAFTTSRRGDFHFTMNAVNLHLAAGRKSGELTVLLESTGPNVARYEARFDEGDWGEVDRAFTWPLSAGQNVLEARAVNTFDVPGDVARAELDC
ncbi:MAG: hypothetical protein ACOC8E_05725 [Planctomycetota bacterium]